ncbi:hypothetical protein EON65_03275 [archaeon]|nr:MAG: hypothetical protein EON65_03275 [archaeon]
MLFIRQLAPQLKDHHDMLCVLTELWCMYMHIISSLLTHSSGDVNDDEDDGTTLSDGVVPAHITHKDIDRVRKHISSTSIHHHLHQHYYLYEHTHTQQNVRQSSMTYVECKVCMHDLIAPPSSVGKINEYL